MSLAYVVPVTGTCDPRQDALEITWLTPREAASEAVSAEMEGGRGVVDGKDRGWGSVGCGCVIVDVIGGNNIVIFGDPNMRGEMMAHRWHCAFRCMYRGYQGYSWEMFFATSYDT